MSDIQLGDLVQITDPKYCRYGSHEPSFPDENFVGHIGTVGRVISIEPDEDLTLPPGEWAALDSLPYEELACVGCLRKLRPADPEFIEQLAATKRPVRAEERV